MRDLDELFAALNRSEFRSRIRLGRREQAYLRKKTLPVVLQHARHFVDQRLTPANPSNDGRQTPMRGHPVFVAQHATATCCRGCLARWHGIGRNQPLSRQQIEHVLRSIERWLRSQGVADEPLPLFSALPEERPSDSSD
jgi:hypothetical protein